MANLAERSLTSLHYEKFMLTKKQIEFVFGVNEVLLNDLLETTDFPKPCWFPRPRGKTQIPMWLFSEVDAWMENWWKKNRGLAYKPELVEDIDEKCRKDWNIIKKMR